ncbi:MAG: phosphopantetheine-binding protein [Sedimenticola sp.]
MHYLQKSRTSRASEEAQELIQEYIALSTELDKYISRRNIKLEGIYQYSEELRPRQKVSFIKRLFLSLKESVSRLARNIHHKKMAKRINNSALPTRERLRALLAQHLTVDQDFLKDHTSIGQLDIDSLDWVEIHMLIEEAFEITLEEMDTDALSQNTHLVKLSELVEKQVNDKLPNKVNSHG